MSEEQQKALLVYLVVVGALVYFAHSNVVTPEKKRVSQLKERVEDLKSRHGAYRLARDQLQELSEEAEAVSTDVLSILEMFPAPKAREGERRVRVYDTFSLSEQISTAARSLTLTPREISPPREFLFRSALVEEQDLSALGDSFQDPGNKESLPPEEARVTPFLGVGQPTFNYEIGGDFKALIQFLAELREQKNFFEISRLDLHQRGATGTVIEAKIAISSLDLSDGMVDAFPQR